MLTVIALPVELPPDPVVKLFTVTPCDIVDQSLDVEESAAASSTAIIASPMSSGCELEQ